MFSFVGIAIVLCSCAIKKNETQNITDGNFESFFNEFTDDSVFQINRISFPIKYSMLSEETDDLILKEVEKDGWRFVDFTEDPLAKNRAIDAFDVKITRKDSLNVDYERAGIDNGISVIYSFAKQGNKWYLISVLDRSN